MVLELTETKTETKTEVLENQKVTRYGWANGYLKTWFVTKNKRQFLPKGSILFFIITGEITGEPISTSDTYPKEGDVISDSDGHRIKVINIEYK